VAPAESTGSTQAAEEPVAGARVTGALPSTGEEVWLVGFIGAGLLLAGAGLGLRARAARAAAEWR
jgi:LPXTG-motif cell wall-anchored protein